jgi:hypothetical protein
MSHQQQDTLGDDDFVNIKISQSSLSDVLIGVERAYVCS